MNPILDGLRAIRAEFDNPKCDLTRGYPLNEDGIACLATDPRVARWGVGDAIHRACVRNLEAAIEAEESLRPITPGMCFHAWAEHPDRTKKEVLALLDRAIARAKLKGAA